MKNLKIEGNKEIIVTFELLGYKYGIQKNKWSHGEDSVVELHYSTIYQLKHEVKNVFSVYMIPKNVEIAKQKLIERKLPEKIEKERLAEIEEHIKIFNSDKKLRKQFDYIFYNDYTEKSVNELVKIIRDISKKQHKVII